MYSGNSANDFCAILKPRYIKVIYIKVQLPIMRQVWAPIAPRTFDSLCVPSHIYNFGSNNVTKIVRLSF